uniref:Uncharacterized protein n=1 Tax=Tetranychus urticae TaxID=32264 RepID=T1L099_TETUR
MTKLGSSSILGMNLFGCKFCDKMPDNTTQFTVFQVVY